MYRIKIKKGVYEYFRFETSARTAVRIRNLIHPIEYRDHRGGAWKPLR